MPRPSQTLRVTIRTPTPADRAVFLDGVKRSRALHRRWVSPPRTAIEFDHYLERFSSDAHLAFLIIERATKHLVGIINISNIIRGSFQSAFLGYYAFAPFARRGLMREGMLLVLDCAFRKLKLHRLEANIQPSNKPSLALAKSCGFVKEGFSRRYLKVCGRWADHERWAIRAEGFHPTRRSDPNG